MLDETVKWVRGRVAAQGVGGNGDLGQCEPDRDGTWLATRTRLSVRPASHQLPSVVFVSNTPHPGYHLSVHLP